MSIKALQDYTFVSKYARYNKEKKRRETWDEAVERVKAMHLRRYSGVEKEIEWAFEQVKQRRVLGSQRVLQFGGTPIERHNARGYNCTVSFCDRLRFFQECFYLLLCGSGTGFSVQKHHIAKLPSFSEARLYSRQSNHPLPYKGFVIPDSIEGWSDALGVLLSSYFASPLFPDYAGCQVAFNYSEIRPAGSPLGSSSGKAPGPKPLMNSLEKIRTLLDRCVNDGQSRLRPIDAYDIVMHASDAVLSGGVRRSATIAVFSPDDELMLKAKTGNWFYENPQRARSNNSCLLLRDSTSIEQFKEIMQSVREFGEPGFVWSDSTELLVNPCVEISMWPVDLMTNLSGWQMCNLCEINGRKIGTIDDFKRAAKAAAIIGTLQAGYADFPYLGEVTERIVRREALLGVSITGIMENPSIILNPDVQKEMASLVKDVNATIAEKIGINVAARTTCVKPAGTTSCILGTSSGIHPHHAKRYFRRVQANKMEAPFQHFSKINPTAVEDSVWSANSTDGVITFCIEVPHTARVKKDMSAVDLLKCVKSTQQNWVIPGTRPEACTQPWLTHNVSNTIQVQEDEWDEVASYLYDNRKYFAGVSLLPSSGDKDYPQAPMCTIYTPSEIVSMYGDGSLLASGLIVDGLVAFNNNLWAACDAAMGIGQYSDIMEWEAKNPEPYANSCPDSVINEWWKKRGAIKKKEDWIRRARQFAQRYFDDDVRKMTYCLKDVSNWKLWLDLDREYKEVDYSDLIEDTDETTLSQEAACAGGACLI